MRRVVITGIGIVTPIGNDLESTWSALLAGKNGAAPITLFDASSFATKFACEVKSWDPSRWMDRREYRHLDRCLPQLAVSTSQQKSADPARAVFLACHDRNRLPRIARGGRGLFRRQLSLRADLRGKGHYTARTQHHLMDPHRAPQSEPTLHNAPTAAVRAVANLTYRQLGRSAPTARDAVHL